MAPTFETSGDSVFFINLQNQCDNACFLFSKVIRFFGENAYHTVDDIGQAQTVVVNTCAYVDKTARDEERDLTQMMERHPGKQFVVYGCLARFTKEFKDRPNVLLVPPEKTELLDATFSRSKRVHEVQSNHLVGFGNYQTALTDGDFFVQISQGCRNKCSYCNIRLVKGGVVSKPIPEITQELQRAVSTGVFEVTLLADDCASYGIDLGTDLVQLLDAGLAVDPRLKLKIYAAHPTAILAALPDYERLVATGRVPYVCLPTQSGSQRILDLMGRGYDIAQVKELVRRLKTASPASYVCTHVMFGFPTETDADLEQSLDLAEVFDFTVFLHFMENARTASARIEPKIDEDEAKRRSEIIVQCLADRRFAGCLTGGT